MAGFLSAFRADVERTYTRPARRIDLALAPFVHPGLCALLLYRIAHRLRDVRLGVGFGRVVAALLKRAMMLLTNAEICPGAALGPGIHLPHPTGVVIGAAATLEGQCTIFQNVTLGSRDETGAMPRVGRDVFLFAGAVIVGDVRIGSGVRVGPNCVVFDDVPSGTTVVVAGARFVPAEASPAQASPAEESSVAEDRASVATT